MRPLTKQVREQIVEMRRAGVSIKLIAAALGIGTTAVKMHSYRAGLRANERVAFTDEEIQLVERMISENATQREISARLGVTFNQARHLIYKLRRDGRIAQAPPERRNRYVGKRALNPGAMLHDMLACGGFPAWREVEDGYTKAAGRGARRLKLVPSLYYPLRDAA